MLTNSGKNIEKLNIKYWLTWCLTVISSDPALNFFSFECWGVERSLLNII